MLKCCALPCSPAAAHALDAASPPGRSPAAPRAARRSLSAAPSSQQTPDGVDERVRERNTRARRARR
jgi:hypothetical protein